MHTNVLRSILVTAGIMLIVVLIRAEKLKAPVASTSRNAVSLDEPQLVTSPPLHTQGGISGTEMVSVPVPPAPSVHMRYEQARIQYANASIHFSSSCRATPGTLKVPIGSKVMLDNTSDEEKDISVNQESFAVQPHNFIITNFPVRRIIRVDCNEKKNVSSVIVQ